MDIQIGDIVCPTSDGINCDWDEADWYWEDNPHGYETPGDIDELTLASGVVEELPLDDPEVVTARFDMGDGTTFIWSMWNDDLFSEYEIDPKATQKAREDARQKWLRDNNMKQLGMFD